MIRGSALVNVMAAAARKAGRGLIRDFGEVEQLQASRKGPAGFVAEADRRAARILRDELTRARPGFGLLLAGEVERTDPEQRWIVHPLDGVVNFLHGVPHFAISIAAERRDEIVAGLVHDPLRDETFWAEKGVGAYVNRRRLRVSARDDPGDAILAVAGPAGNEALPAAIERLADRMAGVRRFGAASLDFAYVAAGRCDACWEVGLAPRETAAGAILVREAGGLVGSGGGAVVAANDLLHRPMLRLLDDAMRRPDLAPAC